MDIITKLQEFEINPIVVDPVADKKETKRQYDIELTDINEITNADCLVFAVAHNEFKNLAPIQVQSMFKSENNDSNVIIDVKSILNKNEYTSTGYRLWRL
jgi:UDP-N-acetyl-D-galactosamine dehydrogenase